MQVAHPSVRQGTQEASVTPLELFFDLVFVFALTQVTAYLASELSWHGLVRGVLIIVLLWWARTGYAWLANVASPDQGPIKVLMMVSMAAMFLLALNIPEAFDDAPGGWPAPVVLALCYSLFRLGHLAMFFYLAGDDHGLRSQLVRFAPSVLGSTALLLVASQFRGWTETAIWVAALAVDYLGTAASGWGGLATAGARALRRAARPDPDRRARRVDRGDRGGGSRPPHVGRDRGGRRPRRLGGLPAVVGLL